MFNTSAFSLSGTSLSCFTGMKSDAFRKEINSTLLATTCESDHACMLTTVTSNIFGIKGR